MTERIIFAVLALVLAAAAGGCGGTNEAAADTRSREDAMLEFARCMRAHGIDVEDPKSNGGGITMRVRVRDRKKIDAAQKECQEQVPGAIKEPTAEEQQRFRDAALKFARCMRRHGVDVPDPKFDGNGGIMMGAPRGGRSQQDLPRFQKAQKACGGLMPGLSTETR